MKKRYWVNKLTGKVFFEKNEMIEEAELFYDGDTSHYDLVIEEW